MLLKNKTVLISGAARGLGFACAKRMAQAGAAVVLTDCQDELGHQSAASLAQQGLSAEYRSMDVTDLEQVHERVKQVVREYGRLDVAVANAGIVDVCDPIEMSEAALDRVLAVNLKGQVFLGQAAAQQMLKQSPDADGQRGSIINMSSIQSTVANPDIASYVVSKGGIQQWTKALALRLAEHQIRVNAIAPGSIATEMFQSLAAEPQKYQRVMSRTPMARAGEPEEIGSIAVFLASSLASYVTAETITADGGRLAQNYPRDLGQFAQAETSS